MVQHGLKVLKENTKFWPPLDPIVDYAVLNVGAAAAGEGPCSGGENQRRRAAGEGGTADSRGSAPRLLLPALLPRQACARASCSTRIGCVGGGCFPRGAAAVRGAAPAAAAWAKHAHLSDMLIEGRAGVAKDVKCRSFSQVTAAARKAALAVPSANSRSVTCNNAARAQEMVCYVYCRGDTRPCTPAAELS
jgi:hypothetical protein